MGWAVERAHPQGISLVISLRLSASTPAHPNVQSTPHGGRGEPRAIAPRWSQAPPSNDCLPGWGQRGGSPGQVGGKVVAGLVQTLKGDGTLLLIILEAPQTTLPWLPRPSRAVTPKGNEILPAQHRLVSAIGFLWPRGKA